MKKIFLLAILSVGMMGCNVVYNDDATEPESSVKTKSVQFVMRGITEEFSTSAPSRISSRMDATIVSASCTDLWIWEGKNLLAHKVSTDADFDTPTLSLTYGIHDLTFLASMSVGQSLDNGVWSCTKVVGDFATTMNVTVSGVSSSSRQVQLTRRNSRVKIQTTDNVPQSVSKLHLVVSNHLSLNASLIGSNAVEREVIVDITNNRGSTYSVFMNVLTESPTDEEDCDVLVEFLDASDNVLYHYERTVSLKPNRCVTLTGAYFTGASNSISIVSTDFEEVNQPLYE